MIQAVTNRQVGLKSVVIVPFAFIHTQSFHSVISELLIGLMLPGRPIAMMLFVFKFSSFDALLTLLQI
jgi:hypothetical protein